MLRELIDVADLEDFVSGIARAHGGRAMVFDARGALLATTPVASAFCHLARWSMTTLPEEMSWASLTGEPPVRVAFAQRDGVWFVVAPVQHQDQIDGFVVLGEFRDPYDSAPPTPPNLSDSEARRWEDAWGALPLLERTGDSRTVATARWASRLLASWRRQETRLHSAAEEMGVVSDIGEMLTGERDLQTVLDRIVQETARVMECSSCSLRLYNPETDELTIAAGYRLTDRYLAKGPILRSENPIDDEALRGGLVYIEDASTDPRIRFREESQRANIVSGLTAGMLYHGRPVGVLRVYASHRKRFRTGRRNLLRAIASQAAIAIVNARMAEQRLRAEALQRQLALAGDLQARLVGGPRPKHPFVETSVLYEPSSHVGGDFCDVLTLADGRIAALVGDVVGHGVAAALLMMTIRGALRVIADTHSNLAEIMSLLNRRLCRETLSNEFVSLLLVALDADGRRLTYCNAGHDAPLIRRVGESGPSLQTDLEEGGLVLGLDESEQYEEGSVALQPEDFALLFTDGAVEAMNFEGELFGRERLRASLLEHGDARANDALRRIRWDIRRFVGLAEQSDDLTLVGLRIEQ